MIDDIYMYVSLKSCDTCQRANDTKFSNIDAALHFIKSCGVYQVELRLHIFLCMCTCHAAPKRLLYILKLLLS